MSSAKVEFHQEPMARKSHTNKCRLVRFHRTLNQVQLPEGPILGGGLLAQHYLCDLLSAHEQYLKGTWQMQLASGDWRAN